MAGARQRDRVWTQRSPLVREMPVTEIDEWVRSILSNMGKTPGPDNEGDVLIDIRYRVGYFPERKYHAQKFDGIWTCFIGDVILYDFSLEGVLRKALLWSKERNVFGR
jgi:hypothetical protein